MLVMSVRGPKFTIELTNPVYITLSIALNSEQHFLWANGSS